MSDHSLPEAASTGAGPRRFEALLSHLSATFTHLPADRIDDEVTRGLADVVAYLDIERCSLAQFSADETQLVVTHSYTAPGYVPMPRIDLAPMWPWYTDQARRGEVIRLRRLPDDFPPEAVAERAAFARGGLPISHLAVPFQVGAAVLGGIGFGSYRRVLDWPDDEVVRLRLIAEVFANALARKVALETVSRLRDQLARTTPPGAGSASDDLRRRADTLTARERQVLALVAAGLPNKRVAAELGVGEKTVKVHRGRVMRKLRAASLADLVRMADRLGLGQPVGGPPP